MYLKNFQDFYTELETITKDNFGDFFMVSRSEPFESLLIQRLIRPINQKEYTFLAIRDFKLNKHFQGKGIFTNTLGILERNQIPILIDDIINPKLEQWLMKRGYEPLKTSKYSQTINSRFKNKYQV